VERVAGSVPRRLKQLGPASIKQAMKKLFLFLLPLTMFAADLVKEVRHELVMLPYYNVFDNLSYRVDGSKVTLFGQVREPKLKSDAEKAVKSIEGVTAIDNQIEVMPLSASDDQVRAEAYRAIYSKPTLQRYQLGAVPPIHIIVKNGDLTLEGVVANQMDKDVAGIAAKGVSGAHKVTNNLRTDK
jgi:hyperosmotically inducible periplasmic protein